MFFIEKRELFFKPLNGKYREQVIECLRVLYSRLYTSMADYSQALNKEQVLACFQEALVRAPLLKEVLDEDVNSSINDDFIENIDSKKLNSREQAIKVLNLLLEHGWIDKLVDEATLQSSYAFTRVGRLFTQPILEMSGARFRTRHRNTRNTRNALQSFLKHGEIYDLLDAYEFSERIVSDFSDIIAELDERKRQLVKEVEQQQVVQQATDEFFDFMEKRFIPDLSVRLSADSVEKYRIEIQNLVSVAKRKRKLKTDTIDKDKDEPPASKSVDFRTAKEKELRNAAPELIGINPKQSVYLMILNAIESRMHTACENKLPELRNALLSFTRRADIIIRQLNFTHSGQRSQLLTICRNLKEADNASQRIDQAAAILSQLNVRIVDPNSLKIHMGRKKHQVNTQTESSQKLDRQSRRQLFLQQALDVAFITSNQDQVNYIIEALKKGHKIETQNLPIRHAKDLLMAVNAIEIGSTGQTSSEFQFIVKPTGETPKTEYFNQLDGYTIELVDLH